MPRYTWAMGQSSQHAGPSDQGHWLFDVLHTNVQLALISIESGYNSRHPIAGDPPKREPGAPPSDYIRSLFEHFQVLPADYGVRVMHEQEQLLAQRSGLNEEAIGAVVRYRARQHYMQAVRDVTQELERALTHQEISKQDIGAITSQIPTVLDDLIEEVRVTGRMAEDRDAPAAGAWQKIARASRSPDRRSGGDDDGPGSGSPSRRH